jgi:cytochrome c oxidase subunit II
MRDALSWMLPPGASTFTGEVDWLYYTILWITGIAFFLVQGALVWVLIKYRARPGVRAHYTHGSAKAEWTWTSVTAVAVVALGLMSAGGWKRMKNAEAAPADAMKIGILAKQFEWHFRYPGPDGQLGTPDDFSVRNQLHLPVDRAVVATLEAEDVIHSFFVAPFRVKQDAVPGMKTLVWFQPNKPGTYEVGCAELCGLGHYRMRAVVTVHTQDDYARWVAERQAPPAAR